MYGTSTSTKYNVSPVSYREAPQKCPTAWDKCPTAWEKHAEALFHHNLPSAADVHALGGLALHAAAMEVVAGIRG